MRLADRLALLRGPAPEPSAAPAATSTGVLSLAERIARIRHTEVNGAPRSARLPDSEVATLLGGVLIADGVIRVDVELPLATVHGKVRLDGIHRARPDLLGLPDTGGPDTLLFLDTETTGLAGGTGTLAFLLGLARVEGSSLCLRQYFLSGFRGEPAMLDDALAWIEGAGTLVSYNGRSFDAPLLSTRFSLARRYDPLRGRAHLDLLPPTRRAFGASWEDCRLQTAERKVLGLTRVDDLPGSLIPQVWSTYLRGGPAGPLTGIVAHNLLDLLSLAALLAVLSDAYAHPGQEQACPGPIAGALRRQGQEALGMAHLEQARERLTEAEQLQLATLYRRRGDLASARRLWDALQERGSLAAILCLAKFHEHVEKRPELALELTDILLAREPHEAGHATRRKRLLARLHGRGEQDPLFDDDARTPFESVIPRTELS